MVKGTYLLRGVVQSNVLDGAPVWSDAVKIKKYKRMLLSLQRRCLLRVISGYRTVSAEAVLLVMLTAAESIRSSRSENGHRRKIQVVEWTITLSRCREKCGQV